MKEDFKVDTNEVEKEDCSELVLRYLRICFSRTLRNRFRMVRNRLLVELEKGNIIEIQIATKKEDK